MPSRDELIHEWLRLDAQIKALADQRKDYAIQLVEIASAEQNGQKTIHLPASDGQQADVLFGTQWDCSQIDIECARELLDDMVFRKVFKIEYIPRARELKSFLSTVFPDERSNTAREIVKDACKEVPKYPYVTAIKRNSEPQF